MTKYWCYICSREFQLAQNVENKKCPTCQQDAFQQMTQQSHPEQFQAYQPGFNAQNIMSQVSVSIMPVAQQIGQLGQPIQGLASIIQNTATALSNTYNQNPQSFGNNPANIIQNSINFSMAHLFSNLPQILNLTGQISTLMQNLINSGQSYRPATPQQIAGLQKIERAHECAICQSQEQGQKPGYKLKCGHQFHTQCIQPWFQRANTCPTCRETI